MAFGRAFAISRICFSCRIWCDSKSENHSYAFKDWRLQRGPARLLEGVRQLQDAAFPEGRTENLQTHRELSADLAARHRNPGHPCQRSCNCINISKIHLQGVVCSLAQLQLWHERGGRPNRVDLGEGITEILCNQRPHFLTF